VRTLSSEMVALNSLCDYDVMMMRHWEKCHCELKTDF